MLEQPSSERRPHLFWRITLVFIAVTLVWLGIRLFVNGTWGSDYTRLTHVIRAVLTSLVIIPLIIEARRLLDQRPWAGLRLTSLREGVRPLLIGAACWLIPALLGLVIVVGMGWTEITFLQSMGDLIGLAVGLMFLVFIYEALPEELIFRGYFYRNLATAMPRWVAVLVQAILFTLWGLLNGGPISLERSALFFMAAIILGCFRAITGSVWASIGFHLAFQTVSQVFGSIGNQILVSQPSVLTLFAFGILPFAFSLSLLQSFYKTPPGWEESDPE